MPQYRSPGVYVEEVPPLSRPIAGVGTSTPAFIGVIPNQLNLPVPPSAGKTTGARWVIYEVLATAGTPYRITSWGEYVKLFGDLLGTSSAPVATALVKVGADTFLRGTAIPGLQVMATWTPAGTPTPSEASGTDFADARGFFNIKVVDGLTIDKFKVTVGTGAAPLSDSQRNLAHAVYGFFNNGGSACYVTRIAAAADLSKALTALAAIDEVTMVAAPGLPADATVYAKLIEHCELLQDRVAILDSVPVVDDLAKMREPLTGAATVGRPQNSTYAAFYFPWIEVFDPGDSLLGKGVNGVGSRWCPPCGHVAGVYARNDSQRGVFKAPANEALLGVTGVRYALSRADQDGLNGVGVNLIRPLIGAFRVWGARTVGGDANGEYRYISTRRYFNYLRESIDQGTQFVVFEPNTPALWQRIVRTLTGFLTNEWRSGALFGETAKQAFYIKCDAETNPDSVREAGQVVTEIGVAIVKPAEFVIFRIQQTTGS